MEQIILNDKKNLKKIKVRLSLVSFIEEKVYVVYCPSLDISGYGQTEKEALKSFETTLSLTFSYCIEHNTLQKLLQSLGWFKGVGAKYKSIPISSKINTNDYLQQVINKHNEVKLTNNYEVSFA
jgi:predicted RNase H-like HicB family nuclease